MIGNSSLFTTFQSHPCTSTITLVGGSKSCVLGSDTINLTALIPLTFVLSLPHFSFNLIYVSKLTRVLNCCISFFSGYCLFQNLLTKGVIGRGQESWRASTFLIQSCQSLLHVLRLPACTKFIVVWVIRLFLC